MNYTPLDLALPNANRLVQGGEGGYDILKKLHELKEELWGSPIPNELCNKVAEQIDRYEYALKNGGSVTQFDVLSKYIDWIKAIPWERMTTDTLNIETAKKTLDSHHYGLESTKQRVLEYLSILLMQKTKLKAGSYRTPVLFFVGLAGTGKTTFAKAVAETLGKSFIRIPFGGLSSVSELRGTNKTTVDAEPGYIIKALVRANSKNCVILLDELDRIADTARSQVMGFLLELLDPEQNSAFIDHYIDYPVDLSKVLFIATANNTQDISTAVLDRLELIQLPSYNDAEKIVIARDYILPKLLKHSGLEGEQIKIDVKVWETIARMSGYDPGIRSVERKVEGIVRRIALELVTNKKKTFMINEQNMNEYVESV